MTPNEFMPRMKAFLEKAGVRFRTGEAVTDVKVMGKKIHQVITDKEAYPADEVVLAAGSWSALIARKLGISLSLQAGKGYRIDVKRPTGIRMPAILMEANMGRYANGGVYPLCRHYGVFRNQ